MTPEQGPRSPEPLGHEEPLDIEVPEEGGMSDKEYKEEALKELYKEKMAYSREMADWQRAYEEKKKSGGLSEEQEKQYQEKIESLRKKIARAAKAKRKAEKQFEAYEKRQAA